MNAKDIVALIEDFLHNPAFNADDVDTDMLKWFADSIDSGDLEIISMHQEGDGAQKLDLFKRPAEKVLRELIGDIRLAGCQHFGFKEYLDPHGNRLLLAIQMDQSLSSWCRFEWVQTRFQFRLSSTLTQRTSRGASPFVPFTVSHFIISYTISYTTSYTISYTISFFFQINVN